MISRLVDSTILNNYSKVRISKKVDGSPAFVCGKDPADGKFFVGTKSVFNKKIPKVIKSLDDIDRLYKDKSKNYKLEYLFNYLSLLNIDGVVQGDLLYTQDTKILNSVLDPDWIRFTPNLISYYVYRNDPEFKKILYSNIGVAFHTTYSGNRLSDMKMVEFVPIHGNDLVWVYDPIYKDYEYLYDTFHDLDTNRRYPILDLLDSILRHKMDERSYFDFIDSQNKHKDISLRCYINHCNYNNLTSDYNGYIEWIIMKCGKSGKVYKVQDYNYYNSIDIITSILNFQKKVVELKNIFLYLFDLDKDSLSSCWIERDGKLLKTRPEGYVIEDIESGCRYKLVDRSEFSRLNIEKWSKCKLENGTSKNGIKNK